MQSLLVVRGYLLATGCRNLKHNGQHASSPSVPAPPPFPSARYAPQKYYRQVLPDIFMVMLCAGYVCLVAYDISQQLKEQRRSRLMAARAAALPQYEAPVIEWPTAPELSRANSRSTHHQGLSRPVTAENSRTGTRSRPASHRQGVGHLVRSRAGSAAPSEAGGVSSYGNSDSESPVRAGIADGPQPVAEGYEWLQQPGHGHYDAEPMSMPGGSPTLSMRLPAGKPGTSSLKAAAGNSRAAKMKCVSMAMGDVPELPSTVALEPVDDGDGDEDAQRIGAAYEGKRSPHVRLVGLCRLQP